MKVNFPSGIPFTQISNQLLNNPHVSFKAKGLWAYLQSKPSGWEFSSKRIASDTKDGVRAIENGLRELEEYGYIQRERLSSGRMQYSLTAETADWAKTAKKPNVRNRRQLKPQTAKTNAISNKEVYKERDIQIKTSTIVEEAKPKKGYGDENINWLIQEFEDIMQFTPKGSVKQERRYAKHLLDNFTKEQLTYMLTYCSTDKYAPRVGSMEKLWFKRGDIIAGIKSKVQNNSPKIISI